MLALEPHRGARLAKESLNGVFVRERLVAHELDGHELIELDVARSDDDAHAARAEHPLDPVLPGEQIPLAHGRRAGTGSFEPN